MSPRPRTTSFARTYDWDITKVVDAESTLSILVGGSVTATYTVDVSVDGGIDSDHAVAGTITITNPNPLTDATIESIADVVSADIAADGRLRGGAFPGTSSRVAPPWSAPTPPACRTTTDRTNTATVTTSGPVPGGSGEAAVIFGDADDGGRRVRRP